MNSELTRNRQKLPRPDWRREQPVDRPVDPLLPGPTVLVIDDDAALLELMYAVLIAAGFNVLTSKRGTRGLVLLHQAAAEVEVVVLDYQMPVMTGAQLLPVVRELAPAAKVLGICGPDPAELAPGFRAGVDRLLKKPFTRTDLIAAVAALLPAATPTPSHEPGLGPIPDWAGRSLASMPAPRQR